MSRATRGTTTAENNDQHFDAGRDLYNPNPAQELYDREFSGIAEGLGDVERKGRAIINDNADTPDKNTNNVRQKESIGSATKRPQTQKSGGFSSKLKSFTVKSKLRGKTSLISVAIVLLGGGGAVSFFGIPIIAPIQFSQILTQDLNDQLKAFEDRHAHIMRAKFKSNTTKSCGVSPLPCRFAKMSDKQAERFANKGVTVERDAGGRITRMTFPDSNGGPDVVVNSGSEMKDKMHNNMAVRTSMQRVENPWFASMSDKTFKTTLRVLGASKASRISGDTNEERERSVNNAIGASEQIDPRTLTPEVDDENKPTGRMIGPDGEVLSQSQIDMINDSARTAEGASKIKPAGIASSIGTTVMATGAVDVACTAFNTSRMVGALSKIEKAKQAAQMVTAVIHTPASKILAGDATEGEIEFVGNKINNIGGPERPEQTVDESKIYDEGSQNNIPMKQDTSMLLTAFDSPGLKAALYGDVTPLDTRHARFSLAGGFIGTLNKVNGYIARVATLGTSSDPKAVSRACKYVQNPYVRGASLVAGVFIGIGSFGTWQAAGIVGSLAISMALPYMISIAADIASGDMFKNLYGDELGSGGFVGTAAIMSTAAQYRGMKPLTSQEAVAYTQSTKESLAHYADTQRYMARAEPFNIKNQYSFLGSLAFAVTPTLSKSQSSVSSMAMGMASLVPQTFASLTGTAKAANTVERFQQCNDPGYESLGIGADLYCNVRYGLSDQELAIDAVENALWMESTGNVAPGDTTGEPIDNGESWNYKKFIDECVNRTVGYGEDQEENQGDGANCLSKENEAKNQRYRIFTMDRSVADYMDGIDEAESSTGTGAQGSVSAEGWAYPTSTDGVTTSGYKPAGRPNHLGLDIAQPGSAMGKPIFAARDGKVIASGPAEGFGNWIVLEHDVDGKKVSTVYGHMRSNDLLVKVGDTVKAGQQIARIGNEGESSGAHLHFEIWNGRRMECNGDCSIDPTAIIDKAKQAPPSNNSTTQNERNM